MDQRKGAIYNKKQDDQISNQAESRILSQKAPLSTNVDDSDGSEYEYIDETTPGPGSYLDISNVKTYKNGKTSTSFGASKRFEANS